MRKWTGYWSSSAGRELWKLSRTKGGTQELTAEERELVGERVRRYQERMAREKAKAKEKYRRRRAEAGLIDGRLKRVGRYGAREAEPDPGQVKALGEMSDVEFQEFRESTYMEIARKGDSHDGVRMKAIEAAQKMRDQMKFGTRAAVEATLAACRKRREELDEIERNLAAVETSELEGGRETPAQQRAQEKGTQLADGRQP